MIEKEYSLWGLSPLALLLQLRCHAHTKALAVPTSGTVITDVKLHGVVQDTVCDLVSGALIGAFGHGCFVAGRVLDQSRLACSLVE